MTAFVESCVGTAAGSAEAAARHAQGRPQASKLLKLLSGKSNILVTTHQHPDPDALASATALCVLLRLKLPAGTRVTMSVKGHMAGGINEAFVRHADLTLAPWDDAALSQYDAIILLDTQPTFPFNPLPAAYPPIAVIDHHRTHGRKPRCPFCDIRTEVGATGSIIFSYFMELEVSIPSNLAATLLYGIETDLSGAAGTPGELDNLALSSLTLVADPRKLYQMRYVDLPQNYYIAYARGIEHALFYDRALISHIETIDSLEKPGVIADFLLRFDKVNWVLVTAIHEGKLIASLRTSDLKLNASDIAQRVFRDIGEGGGHRAKAGGIIALATGSPEEIAKLRSLVGKRFLRALGVRAGVKGAPLPRS